MRIMPVVLAVTAACTLGACAPQPMTRADVEGRVVCDAERMSLIERKARHDGVELRWINCPRVKLVAR